MMSASILLEGYLSPDPLFLSGYPGFNQPEPNSLNPRLAGLLAIPVHGRGAPGGPYSSILVDPLH